MQLQGLIKNLEYRLQKTDQATIEAKEIRDELHKLRKNTSKSRQAEFSTAAQS